MSDVLTRFHRENGGKDLTVERVQDVEPILENNKLLRSIPQKSDWGRHKSCVPNLLWEKWFNEYNEGRNPPDLRIYGPEFTAYVDRKLNDPDYRAFRVDDPSNPYYTGWKK